MGDVTVASTTDSQELVNQAAGGVDQQDTEIEERPVPTGDVQVDSEEEAPASPPEPEKKEEKPVPRGVEKRIDKLVREKKELEARLLALESRQVSAPPPVVETAPASPPVPTQIEEEFDTFPEWQRKQTEAGKPDDLRDYNKAWYAWQKAIEAKQEERAVQIEVENEIKSSYNEKMAAFRAEHDDWEEVVGQNIEILPDAGQAIVENAVPEVAYYLGQHPEEIKKMNAMIPRVAVAYVGKLAAKLEKMVEEAPAPTGSSRSPDRAPVVSRAPAPIKPLTGHAIRNTVDLNDPNLSYAEHCRIREEQEKNRYRR